MARRIALIAATACAVGCGTPTPNVDIDLAVSGRCVAARGRASERVLTHEPGSVVDCYLRLPARSDLIFEVAPATTDVPLRVTLQGALGPEREVPLVRVGTEWRGALGGPTRDPARLRLVNHSDRRLSLSQPRVVGSSRPAPPILGARTRPPDDRPSVLLYVVDTLRADRLGAYGYARPTSPHLDALAARGILFLHAYAPGPNTLASVPTLLSSRHPWEHGGHLRKSSALPTRTLAEAFQSAGYRTAGFQANFILAGPLGLSRGFDNYFVLRASSGKAVTAEELHRQVLEWLGRDRGRPFFVFVQSMDVHGWDEVPAPFAGRFSAGVTPPPVPADVPPVTRKMIETMHPARYDDAVAYMDHEIGRLLAGLDALGLRDRTAVVVTADHGESLGEDGGRRYLHGHSLSEELLHVPLILGLPWMTTPMRVSATVGLIRLAPTLLDLAGIAAPAEFAGRSLLGEEAYSEPPIALGARLRKLGHAEATEVEWYAREGPWKLRTDQTQRRLFDLARDPEETDDLSAREDVWAAYLATRLAGATAGADASGRAHQLQHELDASQRRSLDQSLRALGYVE